jgi:hypothetical protein
VVQEPPQSVRVTVCHGARPSAATSENMLGRMIEPRGQGDRPFKLPRGVKAIKFVSASVIIRQSAAAITTWSVSPSGGRRSIVGPELVCTK